MRHRILIIQLHKKIDGSALYSSYDYKKYGGHPHKLGDVGQSTSPLFDSYTPDDVFVLIFH